jgi:hypothetical protein
MLRMHWKNFQLCTDSTMIGSRCSVECPLKFWIKFSVILMSWDLAEWLERPAANGEVAPVLVSPSGISGALDEAVLTCWSLAGLIHRHGRGFDSPLGRKKFSTWTDPGLRTDSGETYAQMLLAMNGTDCHLQPWGESIANLN